MTGVFGLLLLGVETGFDHLEFDFDVLLNMSLPNDFLRGWVLQGGGKFLDPI